MRYSVEEMDKVDVFRKIAEIPYSELVPFILRYLKNVTFVTFIYWTLCLIYLIVAAFIRFQMKTGLDTLLHALFGLIIFPVLIIPVHELLHIIPYYLTGARNIRIGMDLKQYFFYVTAHRYVAGPVQFIFVALLPFILISAILIILIYQVPEPWKWSLSSFLFVHTTMCAGDAALVNFYFVNRKRKIFTWDDADEKVAYFYEKI